MQYSDTVSGHGEKYIAIGNTVAGCRRAHGGDMWNCGAG